MSTVAEQLRSAREAQNLTVQQVADATKIRTDHVRALEEGKFTAFSATVYIRGSVKIYAKFLKLDEPKLLAALDGELKGTQKFKEPPPLSDQKKGFLDALALLLAKVNWKLGAAVFALAAIALIVGVSFWAWQHHQKNDPLKNLPPAVYQPASADDTLPLHK